MKLELIRKIFTDISTIGELSIDGNFECFTLEDRVRTGPKVEHETAIPTGTYKVTLEISPRFGRVVPRLHDVPNFDGILIHWGNTAKDTSGCILVGANIDSKPNTIDVSRREFFDRLMPKLKAARAAGDEIEIHISGEPDAKPKAKAKLIADPVDTNQIETV